MFERIIVNQIEILPDNQVQDDFEKDLTARQRFIPSESARVSSGREKPVSALTCSGEETGKCAYLCMFARLALVATSGRAGLAGGTHPPVPLKTILD